MEEGGPVMERKRKRLARTLTVFLVVAMTIGFVPQMGMNAFAAAGDPGMSQGAAVLATGANTADAQTVWYGENLDVNGTRYYRRFLG